MEILTLRAPEFRTAIGPPYPYRLYSITYVRPAISYAVIETQWDWPTIFHPPSDLRTASDTGDWYRELRQTIEDAPVSMLTRSMDLLFRNRRLVTNIVDQIIERNRDWIAVPECCTSEALRLFIQRHPQTPGFEKLFSIDRGGRCMGKQAQLKEWQSERDAEEAKQQAIRDAEARRPPTRSGSIEQ